MSAAGRKIATEIASHGPISFARFMEIALYDAECGYYRGARKVFGKAGDFYTAAQMQPVFGRVVAQAFAQLDAPRQDDGRVTVLDWGAGQGDLREELGAFDYRAIDVASERPRCAGIVFANELFDALPVDVARRVGGTWCERRVGLKEGRLEWVDGAALTGEWLDYARHAAEQAQWDDGEVTLELPVRLRQEVRRIDAALTRGHVVALDYGYTLRELRRFPAGTLMSYQRHRAGEDVLADPGERDITAHVPLDTLASYAAEVGWRKVRSESMGQWMLRAGAEDGFKSALKAPSDGTAERLRLQLKTLLFDLGETFRAIEWVKE